MVCLSVFVYQAVSRCDGVRRVVSPESHLSFRLSGGVSSCVCVGPYRFTTSSFTVGLGDPACVYTQCVRADFKPVETSSYFYSLCP